MDDRPREPRDPRGYPRRAVPPGPGAAPRSPAGGRRAPGTPGASDRIQGNLGSSSTPGIRGRLNPDDDRPRAGRGGVPSRANRNVPPGRPNQPPPGALRPEPRPARTPAPAALSEPDTGRPAPGRGNQVAWRVSRGALALVSLIVLSVTGYAWAKNAQANGGLNRADVIDAPADGSIDILLVGMDSRTDAKGNELPAAQLDQLHAGQNTGEIDTDTMILIHIPNGGGQAIGMSIPRDSWVNIPGYGPGKINSAYGLARNAALSQYRTQGRGDAAKMEVDADAAGAKLAIQTVEGLTGIGIDHFAAVNLEGFFQISNAIGGVPVCLLHPVDDRKWSGAYFPNAGQQMVQGIQALEFVRQRHNIPGGSTDLEREQRQQAFLASMAHKILTGGVLTNPGELNQLISAVQSAVTIDSRWDLLGFAQQMSGMSSGNIKFQTIPTVNIDYQPKPGMSAIEVDPAQVQAFVHGAVGGPAQPSNVGSAATSAPAPAQGANSANSAITVSVRNTTGHSGLASKVMNVLTTQGFTQGQTSNAVTRSTSVIFYPAGQQSNAQAVSSALGGGFTLEESSQLTSGSVAVYLGRNYSGPTSATASGGSSGSSGTGASGSSGSGATGSGSSSASGPPAGTTQPISDAGAAPCVN